MSEETKQTSWVRDDVLADVIEGDPMPVQKSKPAAKEKK